MRVARYSRYGGPANIRIVSVQAPAVGPDDVVVKLRAAGLNPADSKVRRGSLPARELPSGIGREFAGTVVAVGSQVSEFVAGDLVLGTGEWVIGEQVSVPQAAVMHLPVGFDIVTASTLPVAAQTAAIALQSQHPLPGQTVLVSAAAGGVGHIAVQLAALQGLNVIGTASPRNFGRLESWGATPVSYGPDLADRLQAAAPAGIDFVLDHHGAETIEAALALGISRERINSISGMATSYGVRSVGRVGLNREVVGSLIALHIDGKLATHVEKTFGFEDIVEAYEHVDSGHVVGKTVLEFP